MQSYDWYWRVCLLGSWYLTGNHLHKLFKLVEELEEIMGSLGGHGAAASLYLLYGLWWLVHSFWLHLTRRDGRGGAHSKESLQRKSYIPLFCCPRIPVDPLLKVLLFGTLLLLVSLLGTTREEVIYTSLPTVSTMQMALLLPM